MLSISESILVWWCICSLGKVANVNFNLHTSTSSIEVFKTHKGLIDYVHRWTCCGMFIGGRVVEWILGGGSHTFWS